MSAMLPTRFPMRRSAWGLAGAVAALHLVFARASVTVPYVFGDEAGYLTKAAALAGLATDAYSSYYPGYALWLAPLYALEPHTLAIYPWVQWINAVLAGAGAWLLLALADAFAPDRPAHVRWLAAAALGCYAPALAYSAFALSENLFIPWVLLLAWLLLRAVEQPTRRRALALALAAAGLMLIHPKGVPAVVALGLGWLAGVRSRGRVEWLRVSAWVGGAVLLFLATHRVAEVFFRHRMGYYSDGVSGHYPGAREVLAQLTAALSPGPLQAMALQAAGQLLYLGVASCGLVLVGLVRAESAASSGARACDVFGRTALVLTVVMTAFFMRDGGRVDALFYGRYDEGVVALVMLPVLLRPPPGRAWWLCAGLVAALGGLLVMAYGSRLEGEVVQLNVFGAQLWRFLGGVGARHLQIAVLAGAGAASVALLGLLRRWRGLPALVGVLFLVGAWQGSIAYLSPESRTNAGRHRIADRIHRDFAQVPCVDYDARAWEYWQRFNDQVLLLPARMHEAAVSPLAPGQPDDGRTHARCSDLVISATPDLQRWYPGARLLQRESGSQERLWWIPRQARGRHDAVAPGRPGDHGRGRGASGE
ncbi:hypothetical protein [Fulvimonas yonginensis]|uniref:4-amino-4-deoxy-L-arabinose transferase-like glycosyltransferase n=1 Tax=Fulvimonas yonginensis TaxID=1495200 RepID=A0ABU8JD54_9GAMM